MTADRATLDKVKDLLLTFSNNLQKADENTFTLRHESARAFIRVDTQDDHSFVTIEILMLKDLRLTRPLLEFVAFDNSYTFGHIYLEPFDGAAVLMFRHTLLAENLDGDELAWAVIGMLKSAARDGEKIKKRFGGKLFHEQA
jgi:hypothetical protein